MNLEVEPIRVSAETQTSLPELSRRGSYKSKEREREREREKERERELNENA
jgi:hypothetical protein